MVKIYPGKSLNEFQTSLRLKGMSEIQARKSVYWGCISRDTCLWELNVHVIIKPNRFCYYVPNEEFKRETCVCDSFHISHFHVCWAVDIRGSVFSAVLSNSCQKTTMADFRYKSIKSWKIDNIDLTQQSSLSIFTNFHNQQIQITWLLPIFVDTDFYWLTTPGKTYSSWLIKIIHQSIPCSHVYQMMKVLTLSLL